MTTVLISGAGVAGSTLAYWLARHGLQPTVVERSTGLRSSGNPVDVRKQAMPIVESMGIVPRLRAAATTATAMSLIDASGRQVVRIPMPGAGGAGPEIELPRTDLAAILYDAAKDDAEWMFHDTITALEQDASGVDVTFERGAARRFDLVVGADGLHSTVRRLAFGPEHEFVRHLGMYIATVPFGKPSESSEVLLYNTPGRLAAIHPSRDNEGAAFIFRHATVPDLDYRDLAQHKRIVAESYEGIGWRVPELLDRLHQADDVYFDGVSMVRLPTWSRGRVALVGDAASCVSLFGDGSSHAIIGAYDLAQALAEHADHEEAFRRYEAQHRKRVEPMQRAVGRSSAVLVPKTRLGIAIRNLAARALPVLSSRS